MAEIAPIYMDYQSTTPCDSRVVDAMLPFFSHEFGNPHSPHRLGQTAAQAVASARQHVASMIGTASTEIFFTSGATESNNLAIKGVCHNAQRTGSPRKRIITCTTEHKCVLESVKYCVSLGFETVFLPVGADGLIDPGSLQSALSTPTLLVSIMGVNNEIGVIQDLPVLALMSREAGAIFHTDAAQAAGKITLNSAIDGYDLVSISGHKLYGPKGIGALRVRHRPLLSVVPMLSGGDQEQGIRPGTLPTALIVGLGEACRIALLEMHTEADRLKILRDHMLHQLQERLPDITVNGSLDRRIPGNLNIVFPKDALALMDACPDLCVSAGSACTSGLHDPSHVLSALGIGEETARRCLRIGFGRYTTEHDVNHAVEQLVSGMKRRKRITLEV